MSITSTLRLSCLLPLAFALPLGPTAASGPATPPVLPSIPAKRISVLDFGAVGDGKTLNTASLQQAINSLGAGGGGTLEIPPGHFLTGALTLVSNLNLHLAKGAVLLLSDDFSAFPQENNRYRACILATNMHDIEMSGEGSIDGQGAAWWQAFEANKAMPHRPVLIRFDRCERIQIVGVELRNSPSFHLVPNLCKDVTIRSVTINAPLNAHNTDGIDPSGSNFLIEGCTIDTGDDDIAIKPSPDENQNFTIKHCHFRHGHGLSIGSGTNGGIKDMTVSYCDFRGTNAGIRIKTARGRGGLVHHVLYDHLIMSGVKFPIDITDYYPQMPKSFVSDPAQPVTNLTPTFSDVSIRDLTAVDSGTAGIIWGLPETPIAGIHFDNVHIFAKRGMTVCHASDIAFVDSEIKAAGGDNFIKSDAQLTGLK